MRLAFLVPIGFAAGAAASRVLLHYAPTAYAVDRAQPLTVVTYWQHFGLLMWIALFVAIAVSSIGYVGALRAGPSTGRANRAPLRMTEMALLSALACAAALCFPALFSSDVYAYAGYGWMALHGISPYAHAAITRRDPLMDAVLWQWGNPPPVCVYGPAFVAFAQAAVALFGGFGPAAPLWALRVAACLTLVACIPLARAALAPFPQRIRDAAAAGIALHPIAIWSCAEGHNDVYLIAIVLAGFALIARGKAFTGAAVVALGALVKAPAFAAAGAAVLAYARDPRFVRVVSGAIAGCAFCALISWAMISTAMRAPSHGSYFPQFSLQYVAAVAFGNSAAIVVACVCAGVLAIGGAWLLWKRNAAGAVLLAMALWVAIPNPYPWYALWVLPVAFVVWETPAGWAIVAFTLCAIFRYLPDATTDLSTGASVAIALAPFAAAAAVLMRDKTRRRWVRPENLKPVPDSAFGHLP